MRDLVLNKTKKDEKVFTKNKRRGTIRKNYNPLKVNYKIYERGSGFYNMKIKELKEIKEGLNWKDKIFIHMFPKTSIKVYKKGIEKGFNSRL